MIGNAMMYIGGILALIGSVMFLPTPANVVDQRNDRAFFVIAIVGAVFLFCGWMLTPEN